MDDTYFVVTGAGGSLGKALIDGLQRRGAAHIYGVSRGEAELPRGVTRIELDLLEKRDVEDAMLLLPFTGAQQVIVLHPVGKFKYEGIARHGYDDEVIASNLKTFTNVAEPLVLRQGGDFAKVAFCCFGSVSDKYQVPMWSSYSFAKNRLRDELYRQATFGGRSALMVNTSSIATKNETRLRPKAQTTYWLSPDEVADATLEKLLAREEESYREIDIVKRSPEWHEGYYEDKLVLHVKWLREMGAFDERQA